MNAAEFYEQFKDSLKFLGIPWGEMHRATVKIDGDHVELSTPIAKAAFTVPVKTPK